MQNRIASLRRNPQPPPSSAYPTDNETDNVGPSASPLDDDDAAAGVAAYPVVYDDDARVAAYPVDDQDYNAGVAAYPVGDDDNNYDEGGMTMAAAAGYPVSIIKMELL